MVSLASHLHACHRSDHVCLVFLRIIFLLEHILELFTATSLWIGHLEAHLEEYLFVTTSLYVEIFQYGHVHVRERFLGIDDAVETQTDAINKTM